MVSVIIPVYNALPYLAECIVSICNQTYRNLEIIAVDDGSTDGSAELLDEIAGKDTRIKVVHIDNGGVSSARNKGLALAHGEYISFVDSDDTLEPDMYEMLASTAEQYNAAIAHCSYSRLMRTEQRPIGGSGKIFVQTGTEAQMCLLKGELFTGSLCDKLFRRELFESIRLCEDLRINEDVLAVFQLFQCADTTVFVDVCKYNYRTSSTSSCAKTDWLKKSRDCIKATERMRDIAADQTVQKLVDERLLRCLLGYYRNLLVSGYRNSATERSQISQEIRKLEGRGTNISGKKLFEYWLMRNAPYVYVAMYSIYDKIRTPNWDI